MKEKKSGMSIRKKLLLSYFSIVILIFVTGFAGIRNLREVYENGKEIYVNNLKSVEYLKSIQQNVKEIDRCVISMLSGVDMAHQKSYADEMEELQSKNVELMERYEDLDVATLEERRYNQCRLSILTFNKQLQTIVNQIESGDQMGAVSVYEQEMMPAKACTYELIEAVVELSEANAQEKNEENLHIYQNLIALIGLVMLLSVIVAVVITVRMSNYFTKKLHAIRQLAKRISEYNIADDIQDMENDEFGMTMEALNDSQFMIRELMEKIIEESADISDTGEEVSLAVRKSNQRIETVNVKVYHADTMATEIKEILDGVLENKELDTEAIRQAAEILGKSKSMITDLDAVQAELSSIAMYLEQIGITSDYQNEIANAHREQIKKFKV